MENKRVAGFFGWLGLKIDAKAWNEGQKKIDGMKTAVLGLGVLFGARALGKALIGFNSNVEDTKNKIAGMLALTKKTDLVDELQNANRLYENLQRRAATLPGTTSEYANMLGMITQPVTDAKLGLQDLEDITVNAVVAAKALGVEWEVAARDIDQAIRGQFKSVDQLTGKILGSVGYKGEEGRARFNAMDSTKRATVLKDALGQKQIKQLAEAQGKTFSGVLSTLKDSLEQFMGRVGIPIFKALGDAIRRANEFLAANKEEVAAVAAAIGGALLVAFEALGEVVSFFVEHSDLAIAIILAITAAFVAMGIAATVAWVAATWPILLAIAAVAAIIYAIRKVITHSDKIKQAFRLVWDWIADKAEWLGTRVSNVFDDIKTNASNVLDWIMAKAIAVQDAMLVISGREDETSYGKRNTRLGAAVQSYDARNPNWQTALPSVAVPGSYGAVQTNTIGDIHLGPINVPPGADPVKVAEQVNAALQKALIEMLTNRGVIPASGTSK